MRFFVKCAALGLAGLAAIGSAEAAGAAGERTPMAPPAFQDEAFAAWLTGFRQKAMQAGISPRIFDQAMRGASPDPKVIEANLNQPEFTRAVWEYLDSALSDTRVAGGQEKLRMYARTLEGLERKYGVDRHAIVAIWGLESGYGRFKGTHNVPRALATLAYAGRRQDFGNQQLLAALKILQRGDIPVAEMTGSWAGAMGHTQFIPTTYNAYAVDADGDGRRDIWNSVADALGSTAHYLSASGWQSGRRWGLEVKLPDGFDYALADPSVRKPLAAWKKLGVKPAKGSSFDWQAEAASLVLPAGYEGPAFLVGQNFRAILRYNNSTSYALAVSLLSERFQGKGTIAADWPRAQRPLARAEREELQRLLTAKGYDTQGVDGILGANTRDALRAWQRAKGLPADGHPTPEILARLRRS